MEVYVEKEDKKIEIDFRGTMSGLMKKLKINPETVLLIKNDELVTKDEKVGSKDKVKFVSVISGG